MRVRVHVPPPGFFLADTAVELWIDDRLGYRGSFRSRFEVWATMALRYSRLWGNFKSRPSVAIAPG